jgi:single-strand DNA-binding protein
MADLNKVFLMGRLTFDPELRYAPSGSAVTELRLAVNRGWTGRDGERKEETLFIDITVWDRQAENCCQYLKKGSQVHIEGALKMDTWDDKTTGEKRSKIKVLADRVQFLDRRGDSGAGADQDYSAAPASGPGPGAGPGPARDLPPRRSPAAGPEGRGPNPSNGPGRGYGAPGASPAGRRPMAEPDPEPDDDIPF